ncbi:helix-turn-helix domain containing protein [Kribbella solani]|uniref:TetR/AcrR family transcriptional regulator n=1 Tax=Kribbella solani TaxID=236067 RepID=UPI0029AB972B|nr:helix-turn-helix domain-containing protein [Kribbella solani]MDX2967551.1 helix-turn-helix domain containing protein [Kribbella solani]MDX3002483.1 helix-turn-helix domain containing protein [Kribbella solani]
MVDARSSDLTARARLRLAALKLFAEHGFEATSTRAIATEAGVSHALLRHHYGSKDGLRAAVDEDVLNTFDEGLAKLDAADLAALGQVTARLFGSDELRRKYLRRVLLEGGPAGIAVFQQLLEGARRHLAALRTEPIDEADARWAPYQVLFLTLGPMLLEPVLAATLDHLVFAPGPLAERSAANQRLIGKGLLGFR